jgi:uncharacterized protein YcnI
MKKRIAMLAAILTMIGLTPSSAHVGANLRGFSDVAGQSSTVYLRLGHGCTDGTNSFGTSVFEVVVPIEAGTPRPEFKAGWRARVVPSAEKNDKGVSLSNTVTWTARSLTHAIDHGTFAEFAFQVRWSVAITSPTRVAFPTTQVCKRGLQDFNTKKKAPNDFFLRWIITDGTTRADTADTEFGPAPTVTVRPAA